MQANIAGTTTPILEVTLGPGEEIVSTHAELAWITPGIQLSQSAGAGGGGGLMRGLKRVGLQQSFRGGMWGGDGFVLQRLEGEGRAWIELSGELTTYQLPPGQTLLVHPGHVGMFEGSVQFQITQMRGIANIAFGGDGFHLVALTGPGQIWLQSLPLVQLAHAIQPYLPAPGGPSSDSGGGIVGDMFRS